MSRSDVIADHQSRVIEVDSWDDYISEFKNMRATYRSSVLGSLHGFSLPKHSRVENLAHDEKHLSCDVYNSFGFKIKKLAYLV